MALDKIVDSRRNTVKDPNESFTSNENGSGSNPASLTKKK